MQTFVPYPSFEESAKALDTKRLGKQRVEALQIIRALTREKYGWKHHPAVLMWKGYEEALGAYAMAVIEEWVRRGHADTCDLTIRTDLAEAGITRIRSERELLRAKKMPPWWGDEPVHLSHRSALLRKDPDFYRPHFPDEPDDLEYVWPVRKSA
ncbi:MAG TPA: MSMEG_6728 family protein [Acidimicrobiales bacterium]|jgi:hypothetical protein|nr:MSMEG_6728 family protein [Acidimicrobiales bacterium]